MKNYAFIEHTADIGIRVKGKNLKDLFKNAAQAMFEIIAEKITALPSKKKTLKLKERADNIEELFINWLNDLLSLSAAKELVLCDFRINKLDKNNLEADLSGCDIKGYKINKEVKAATYHQLKLEKIKSGWQAEVIFDV